MEISDCRRQQHNNGAFASDMGLLWVLTCSKIFNSFELKTLEAIGFLGWEQLENENGKNAYVKWNNTTMKNRHLLHVATIMRMLCN